MRITNPTHWNTKDISKLIYRVAQDELDRGQLKRARVKIVYARINTWTLGRCCYGTNLSPRVYMTLVLPRPGKQIDLVQLAKVIAHELGHSKGLRHRDMNNARYGWVEGWRERYAWATEYKIGTKPEPTKLSREERLAERRAESAEKAQKMVRKWKTVAKRANTMLKKWRVRLKAASRRTTLPLAATTVPPAETKLAADNCEGKTPSPAS